MFSLEGKVALVTGGSRGIGRAIALGFAGAGAKVAVLSRKVKDVEEVAGEIRAMGREALALPAHVGHAEEVRLAVSQIEEEWGRIDVLVNNAGTNPYFGPLMGIDEPLWDKTLEVNLKGPLLVTQAVQPLMARSGGGSIVNTSSILGLKAEILMGAYAVSKAGLIMFTRVLARELANDGIRVNAIAPGVIKTRFSEAFWSNEAILNDTLRGQAIRRLGMPEDVVGAALYLASRASAFVTGTVIVVDGGGLA
jgi:NAD(P)-dependent dehydrogenase (short-subunit alcohol dehydrogenase family)